MSVGYSVNKLLKDGVEISEADLRAGDVITIFTGNGYPVLRVDPKTRSTTAEHQRFVWKGDGSLEIFHANKNN